MWISGIANNLPAVKRAGVKVGIHTLPIGDEAANIDRTCRASDHAELRANVLGASALQGEAPSNSRRTVTMR
jgi:hypothetical protein